MERGTLRLHYVQKPIGTERYEIVRAAKDGGAQLTADFDFTDRGGRVQLAATLQTVPIVSRRRLEGASVVTISDA